jgi:DNA invertase Pin-like site-specific DNA recombinase
MSAAKAIAYYRTSSATNVGTDKDSLARQKAAVTAYARAHGIRIVDEFYDAAVSGADPIEARPGFLDMLARITGNGVRCILMESANRFARDLIVQETGWRFLQAKGIELIAVDSPEAFLADTPTAVLIRQILGAVSQFEKASLVAKLKVARVASVGRPASVRDAQATLRLIPHWSSMCAACGEPGSRSTESAWRYRPRAS